MTRYRFEPKGKALVRDDGITMLTIESASCSRSFLITAGKELANKLNGIEQGKEAAMRSEAMRTANKPILRAPSTRHLKL